MEILSPVIITIACPIFADIFFGGEALTAEQPQAFTCPYCSKMGFSEAFLQEHVTTEHPDTSLEVVSIAHSSQVLITFSMKLP